MIMSPVVRRYVSEEGENWRMWYNGRDSDFDSDVLNMVTGRIGWVQFALTNDSLRICILILNLHPNP
jgi:hypothetical protein